MKKIKRTCVFLVILVIGPILSVACGQIHLDRDWRTASRTSANIAPSSNHPEAIVQIYSARAFNWRGIFAVHTWIATKLPQDEHFVVHDVIGWRKFSHRPVLASYVDTPDRLWFGNRPEILVDLRGKPAEIAIPKIVHAIQNYPYSSNYRLWPGPNSNTFTAYVGREVPDLGLHLPPTAIGKDFPANFYIFSTSPSGTGYQASVGGLLGLTAAWHEGIEVSALGLVVGLDIRRPAIKLPGIGRLGFPQD